MLEAGVTENVEEEGGDVMDDDDDDEKAAAEEPHDVNAITGTDAVTGLPAQVRACCLLRSPPSSHARPSPPQELTAYDWGAEIARQKEAEAAAALNGAVDGTVVADADADALDTTPSNVDPLSGAVDYLQAPTMEDINEEAKRNTFRRRHLSMTGNAMRAGKAAEQARPRHSATTQP